MPELRYGPIKHVNDYFDLASLDVVGESRRRASVRRMLRFALGTSPLFPKDGYPLELDLECAVSVTTNIDVIKARMLRPALALVLTLSAGAFVPGIVDVVRNEHRSQPGVEQEDKPNLAPTPGAPTAEPTIQPQGTDFSQSPIWKTE